MVTQTNVIQRRMMDEEGGQYKGEKAACDADPGDQDESSDPPCAVYHKIYNMQDNMDRKMYTDQTGKFPVRSSRGMQYVMVLLEIQSNSILVAGMRNRTSGEMVQAYQSMIDRLKESNIEPTMNILDNECSAEYKEAIKSNNMTHQLVPPNDHRRNIAEKAIQVFKDHFVSVLCGTAVDFPMHLWCRLLRQAEHQLNMLRKSRVEQIGQATKCYMGTTITMRTHSPP